MSNEYDLFDAAQVKGLEITDFMWLDFKHGRFLLIRWANKRYNFGPFYVPEGATPEFVALLAEKVRRLAKRNK